LPEPLEGPATELAAILLTIVAGAALDALDGAIVALGEVRLLAAVEAGGRNGKTAQRLLDNAAVIRTKVSVGRSMALVTASGLTVHLLARDGWTWLVLLGLGAVAFFYSAAAGTLGALTRARAATWALPMARWLRPVELMVTPFALPLQALVSLIDRLFAPPPKPASDDHAVREVEHMIEKREESGSITEEFAELLLSVVEFKDTVAREVMVPRTQVKALEISASIDEAVEMIERQGHSRYPVYRGRLDQIEGVLYAKDLFRILRSGEQDSHESLAGIIRRPAFFVAETQKIGQLLREMQARRFHLAVLVDEFGGTSGVVTLEDIVEEIVGEIQDEHDAEETPIQEVAKGHWWVDASVSILDLSRVLDVDLETEAGDFDSVGGMIVEMAGQVPEVGESVSFRGFQFVVREADERHVTRVEVSVQPGVGGSEDVAAE